jgi:hypothetical protein
MWGRQRREATRLCEEPVEEVHDARGARLQANWSMSAQWNAWSETAKLVGLFIVVRDLARQGQPSDASCEAANAAVGRLT